jgi:hypothetical protein
VITLKPQPFEIAVKNMKRLLATFFSIALSATILGAGNARETNTFIETYDDGTDVGLWHCSVNVPRTLETDGGNPGAYLQQGGFSSHVPTWASVSTRFQPGVNAGRERRAIGNGSDCRCPSWPWVRV